MNTKTAATLLGRSFAGMQSAELEWWKSFLGTTHQRERMYALYGARYLEFFHAEFEAAVRAVEFGSGPLPAAVLLRNAGYMAVDTLMGEYIKSGLVGDGIRWVHQSGELQRESYDTALLLNVLDHTDDPEAMVADAWRVLIYGGKVLMFVHLDNQDDKHRLVSKVDVMRWMGLAGFKTTRSELAPATLYDPPAYLAVGVK
jgi:SAM-dependent methyltransferase